MLPEHHDRQHRRKRSSRSPQRPRHRRHTFQADEKQHRPTTPPKTMIATNVGGTPAQRCLSRRRPRPATIKTTAAPAFDSPASSQGRNQQRDTAKRSAQAKRSGRQQPYDGTDPPASTTMPASSRRYPRSPPPDRHDVARPPLSRRSGNPAGAAGRDYIGRTVNTAARIATYARRRGAGERRRPACCWFAGCEFEPIGPAELKGVHASEAGQRADVALSRRTRRFHQTGRPAVVRDNRPPSRAAADFAGVITNGFGGELDDRGSLRPASVPRTSPAPGRRRAS